MKTVRVILSQEAEEVYLLECTGTYFKK